MKKKSHSGSGPKGNLFPFGNIKNTQQVTPARAAKQAIGATVQPNIMTPPSANNTVDGAKYSKGYVPPNPSLHQQPKPGAGPISKSNTNYSKHGNQ
jgi:hypothetical protein